MSTTVSDCNQLLFKMLQLQNSHLACARAHNSQSLEKPPNSTIVTIEGRILRAILHKKHAFDIFFVATVTLLGSFENTLFVKHTIVYFYNSTCVSETEVL